MHLNDDSDAIKNLSNEKKRTGSEEATYASSQEWPPHATAYSRVQNSMSGPIHGLDPLVFFLIFLWTLLSDIFSCIPSSLLLEKSFRYLTSSMTETDINSGILKKR